MNKYIIVATHKKFKEPSFDDSYYIYKNGSVYERIDGYNRDDNGENLSNLQPILCELSSLYYVWKNKKSDIIGLVHYRRYFAKNGKILNSQMIDNIFKTTNVILPKKRRYLFKTPTNYYIFGRSHNKKTTSIRANYIKILKNTLYELYPEQKECIDFTFNKRYAHLKNMFIMKYEEFDSYCTFLFNVLLTMNEKCEFKDRALGTMGEYLLDVWININNIKYKEIKVLCTDKKENIFTFLKRFFIG